MRDLQMHDVKMRDVKMNDLQMHDLQMHDFSEVVIEWLSNVVFYKCLTSPKSS